MAEESGWVIEHKNSPAYEPLYWAGNEWSKDNLRAIRFCREEDARREAKGWEEDDPLPHEQSEHRIAEHGWYGPLSAAPQTHSTDDEARTTAKRLQEYADDPMWADHAEVGKHWLRRAATLLLSRIPSEEATEEDAFKTCDAIEAVMSKWQSVPSNGGYVVSQFSQAGLRITRTPGGQT